MKRLLIYLPGKMKRLSLEDKIYITPPQLYLALFLIFGLCLIFVFSFLHVENYNIIWKFVTSNYISHLTNPIFLRAFLTSIKIGAGATAICLAFCYPAVYVIVRYLDEFKPFAVFLIILPFFTVYLIRAYSWLVLLGHSGILNSALVKWGIVSKPLEIFNYGDFAVMLGLAHAFLPFMLLALYSSFQGLDFNLVKAAKDLGAGDLRAHFDIVFPLVRPGVISGCLLVFIPSFGAYVTPKLLGAGRVEMVATLIERMIKGTYSIGLASAASIIVIAFVLLIVGAIFYFVPPEELVGG